MIRPSDAGRWMPCMGEKPETFTVRYLIKALDLDSHERSGFVRSAATGALCEPSQIFVKVDEEGECFWLHADGSYVSGWRTASNYQARRFRIWDRWRIRKAYRHWLYRKARALVS